MQAILLIGAYLIGSVPVGLILTRLVLREDIRRHGSGNIGTINVYRLGGFGLAAAVLAADALKGALPVLAAGSMGLGPLWMVLVGMIAIAGHNWSVFLRFSGGKGVATSLGVLIALSPAVAGVCFLTWLAVVLLTGYSSVGSMAAAVLIPITMLFFRLPTEYVAFGVVAALFVVIRHRANIRRLLRGEELKIVRRRATKTPGAEG